MTFREVFVMGSCDDQFSYMDRQRIPQRYNTFTGTILVLVQYYYCIRGHGSTFLERGLSFTNKQTYKHSQKGFLIQGLHPLGYQSVVPYRHVTIVDPIKLCKAD